MWRNTALWALILAVAVFRLLPHPPNFTPVLALALFGGAQFRDRLSAWAAPLAAMGLSDLVLGMHASWAWVYGALLLNVFLARASLRARRGPGRLLVVTLCGSTLFFLLTNFGAWATLPQLYGRDAAGLLEAYVAGLPFWRNALAGDLVFTFALFGLWHAAERRWPVLAGGRTAALAS
ncbi:MAG: hypothetical protein KatS3mg121_0916 [Gammaproteobacteria bacterium]|nr:MAG: hypothetical protein KatS3mg121_0916 [Gammaproteobacteria bacterium]